MTSDCRFGGMRQRRAVSNGERSNNVNRHSIGEHASAVDRAGCDCNAGDDCAYGGCSYGETGRNS